MVTIQKSYEIFIAHYFVYIEQQLQKHNNRPCKLWLNAAKLHFRPNEI